MKRLGFACLMFALLPTLVAAQDSYESLLARAKTGDITVDYAKLRYAYADSPSSHSYSDRDEVTAGYRALSNKEFEKALTISKSILDHMFVSLDGQFIAYAAESELGHKQEADFRRDTLKRLIKGILDSGDGKTMETAYVVINTHEEYFLMRHVWNVRLPKSQSLVSDKKHAYDKIVMLMADGQEQTVFFNIDREMNALEKELGH